MVKQIKYSACTRVQSRYSIIEGIKYYSGVFKEDSIASINKKYHYISAPNVLTAIFVQEDSAGTLYHLLKGHLGSLTTELESKSGKINVIQPTM